MGSSFGNNIRITIFGQSHSEAIGMTLEGIPAGIRLDKTKLGEFMERRAPGRNPWSTARKEADVPEFISGLRDGITCGAPITAIIKNTDTKSGDYSNLAAVPRPGHADHTAYMKYGKAHDIAGGGHFSGRLTAPLCIAGGICMQLLEARGIAVAARVISVGKIKDETTLEEILKAEAQSIEDKSNASDHGTEQKNDPEAGEHSGQALLSIKDKLLKKTIPVWDDLKAEEMIKRILDAKSEGNSVGGVIECAVFGLPAGIGEPMFDGMENRISQAVFAIPAVKGIEFGSGFESAELEGSENNDAYYICGGKVWTRTNHSGGILGGITNGMPLVFRIAVKPTPSIALEQDSVNLETMREEKLKIKGRHDPCIAVRAVPCVEAAAAAAIYDALLDFNKYREE